MREKGKRERRREKEYEGNSENVHVSKELAKGRKRKED